MPTSVTVFFWDVTQRFPRKVLARGLRFCLPPKEVDLYHVKCSFDMFELLFWDLGPPAVFILNPCFPLRLRVVHHTPYFPQPGTQYPGIPPPRFLSDLAAINLQTLFTCLHIVAMVQVGRICFNRRTSGDRLILLFLFRPGNRHV